MDVLLLGLAWDIYQALGIALDTLFTIFIEVSQTTTKIIDIGTIIDNIYILVSVVMLFYITIHLLTYLVNPEKITEKTSGGTKIISKFIITLALLVFMPTIFSLSRDLQTAVINEHIIEKVILSSDRSSDESTSAFQSKSHDIMATLTKAFLRPLRNQGEDDPMYSDPFFIARDKSLSGLKTYAQDKTNYEFNWIMAIVSLVLLCLIVFNFLFDISIRVIKLIFMELIAPIPILTYPLSGKNNFFSKWSKETLMSYASLFIRLLIIYFFLFFVEKISETTIIDEQPIIAAFLIVGALLFAKQLPKLIQDIFGIKMDGSFSLNPMRRVREVPLLGSAVQTTGAAVGGLVTGTALGYRAAGGVKGIASAFKENGFKGGISNLGNITGMAGGGMIFGARAGFNQTKLFGVAAKDQKVDKTAYTAGASAVAQAITGSDKASSGLADRFFNNIGTELNNPAYEQKKEIGRREKAYDEAVHELSVLQDSEREIASNHGVAEAKVQELTGRLNNIDSKITTFTTNRATNRATMIANETTRIDTQIAGIESNRSTIMDNATRDVDSKISQAYSDYTAGNINLSERDARITRYTAEKSAIRQTVENSISQEITNLQIQKTNIERTVDNQLDSEYNTLVTERNTVNNSLSEANAVYTSYDAQLKDARTKVADAVTKKDNAKQAKEDAKNKLKDMQGQYKKNE